LGAQLLGCALADGELFYCSPLAAAPGASVRGGVPVLFPQFAERGRLAKHGFARTVDWTSVGQNPANDADSLFFELDTLKVAAADWPYQARLQLSVEVRSASCVLALSIENCGSAPFAWTGGLHPYFKVSNIRSIWIEGLASLPVEDRYDPELIAETSNGPSFSDRAIERLYGVACPLRLVDGARRLTLRSSGFSEWMVWNPGRDGARALADLPDDDWSNFICIEPVIARCPAILAPGAIFQGVLSITTDE
jgi:glucose-6-phosphate 1-epimerase